MALTGFRLAAKSLWGAIGVHRGPRTLPLCVRSTALWVVWECDALDCDSEDNAVECNRLEQLPIV